MWCRQELTIVVCNSIGRCISETGHLDAPVILRTNKTRGDQRAPRIVLISSSPVHLSTCKYFSRGQDALWFPTLATPLRSISLNGSLLMHSVHFLPSLELEIYTRYLPLGYPDYHSAMVAHVECSCARLRFKNVVHCPDPLPIHLPCLAV